jgi:pimeloyl-ACP methyl ester carboxylesterase
VPSFRANRQAVDVAGFRGRYWDIGPRDGPVVVLLPSQLARGQAYLRTANAIARRGLRVVVVEMPGSGGGSRVEPPWTKDHYARWLAGFLERLRLSGVTLIGHSNSGVAALLVAAGQPQRVAGLILADSTGARDLGTIPGVLASHTPEFPFEYWFTWRGGPDVFFNMLVHWRNFWAQVRCAVNDVVIQEARRVQAPTLVAWGAYDATVPVDCAELFRNAIPGARLYWSPDGRHDWIIEHPEEFAAMAAAFVGDVTPASPERRRRL